MGKGRGEGRRDALTRRRPSLIQGFRLRRWRSTGAGSVVEWRLPRQDDAARSALDLRDPDLGVLLTVSATGPGVLGAAELMEDQLRPLVLPDDLGDDAGPLDERLPDPHLLPLRLDAQHLAELDVGTRLAFPQVDEERVPFGDPVLSAAVSEDRVHSLNSFIGVEEVLTRPGLAPKV